MAIGLRAALRAAGLRVAPGRLAVLEALDRHPHSTAETLKVASAAGLLIQSVHNVLADLTAARIIRRTKPVGFPALYERCIGDDHHYVVCPKRGAVADLDCIHGEAHCLTASNTNGLTIEAAEIPFWGQYPLCQQKITKPKETAS